MTAHDTTHHVDAARLAGLARSILSCPADADLRVDGTDATTPVPVSGTGDGEHLTLQESDGRPVLTCPPAAPLARAAGEGRGAVLTLTSGLGRPGSPDRRVVLTLTGRLEDAGTEPCPCCAEPRTAAVLHPQLVLLTRHDEHGTGLRTRVPLRAFWSPAHELNRGLLQRTAEHANDCHQGELRVAAAALAVSRPGAVAGATLSDLSPDGLTLTWVDAAGAHQRSLPFPRAARGPRDLGELIRDRLHPGIC
ncbi:DUF2470 domain-containing protein [Nocardioides sp. YIM 152588]|uniref:DUF2470 domain-containing protein n=1 Tax=Nocardioides sp. YIM 152588 TaxID=3158259 RepID=UPI0032E47B89